MLVLDANVAVAACAEPEGFADLNEIELVAPPLMWSEFFSLTHEAHVALAQILDCRLVTLDGRLRRGAERLGFVVTPAEL
ncbi:MAG: hypothetical protein ACRET2_15855 [Steroidobacteraceae bacterium]